MSGKHLFTICAVALGLTAGALAQQEQGTSGGQSGYGTSGSGTTENQGTSGQSGMERHGMSGMHQGQLHLDKASQILSREVRDPKGEKLGKLYDLAIDVDRDRVMYGIVDYGGLLGFRDKYYAVPFTAFNFQPDQKRFTLNIDRDRLKNGPNFDKNNWQDLAKEDWNRNVYSYYNQQPYWERERGLRGEPISPEQRGTEQQRSEQGTEQQSDQGTTGGMSGTSGGMSGMRSTAGQLHIVRADGQLMNTGVLDSKNEKIGTIEDLFVDQRTGDVAFAVVKFDADKIGLDNKDQNYAAIPFEALNVSTPGNMKDRPNITLTNTDRVKGHTFSKNNWPDFNNRQQVESLYQAWGTKPYWHRTGQMGTMHRGGESGMRGGTGGTSGENTGGTNER